MLPPSSSSSTSPGKSNRPISSSSLTYTSRMANTGNTHNNNNNSNSNRRSTITLTTTTLSPNTPNILSSHSPQIQSQSLGRNINSNMNMTRSSSLPLSQNGNGNNQNSTYSHQKTAINASTIYPFQQQHDDSIHTRQTTTLLSTSISKTSGSIAAIGTGAGGGGDTISNSSYEIRKNVSKSEMIGLIGQMTRKEGQKEDNNNNFRRLASSSYFNYYQDNEKTSKTDFGNSQSHSENMNMVDTLRKAEEEFSHHHDINNQSNGTKTVTNLKSVTARASEEEISIRVCDDARNVTKVFPCNKELLMEKIHYFRSYLDSSNPADIDISVHCDVLIFEWLMKYIRATDVKRQPELETSTVVSILISAEFLEMEDLFFECIDFLCDNIHYIIRLPIDFACLSEEILYHIVMRLDLQKILSLKDKKDRLTSKIFRMRTKLEFMDLKTYSQYIAKFYNDQVSDVKKQEKQSQSSAYFQDQMMLQDGGNINSIHNSNVQSQNNSTTLLNNSNSKNKPWNSGNGYNRNQGNTTQGNKNNNHNTTANNNNTSTMAGNGNHKAEKYTGENLDILCPINKSSFVFQGKTRHQNLNRMIPKVILSCCKWCGQIYPNSSANKHNLNFKIVELIEEGCVYHNNNSTSSSNNINGKSKKKSTNTKDDNDSTKKSSRKSTSSSSSSSCLNFNAKNKLIGDENLTYFQQHIIKWNNESKDSQNSLKDTFQLLNFTKESKCSNAPPTIGLRGEYITVHSPYMNWSLEKFTKRCKDVHLMKAQEVYFLLYGYSYSVKCSFCKEIYSLHDSDKCLRHPDEEGVYTEGSGIGYYSCCKQPCYRFLAAPSVLNISSSLMPGQMENQKVSKGCCSGDHIPAFSTLFNTKKTIIGGKTDEDHDNIINLSNEEKNKDRNDFSINASKFLLKKEAEIQLLLNGNKRNMILALAHRELLHDEANAYVKNFHKEMGIAPYMKMEKPEKKSKDLDSDNISSKTGKNLSLHGHRPNTASIGGSGANGSNRTRGGRPGSSSLSSKERKEKDRKNVINNASIALQEEEKRCMYVSQMAKQNNYLYNTISNMNISGTYDVDSFVNNKTISGGVLSSLNKGNIDNIALSSSRSNSTSNSSSSDEITNYYNRNIDLYKDMFIVENIFRSSPASIYTPTSSNQFAIFQQAHNEQHKYNRYHHQMYKNRQKKNVNKAITITKTISSSHGGKHRTKEKEKETEAADSTYDLSANILSQTHPMKADPSNSLQNVMNINLEDYKFATIAPDGKFASFSGSSSTSANT